MKACPWYRVVAGLLLMLGLGRAWSGTGTVYLEYTDPQGTVLAEADVQGHIVARYDYRPYGGVVSGSGPNGPGYTGHVQDPETGLVYMQARYYQARGQFLSPDPVGPSPGDIFSFNRYAYANNNPARYTDPDGRCADGLSCDQMVRNYGAWADANPEAADKLGTVGVAGVTAMLSATGFSEVVGLVKGAIVVDKILSDASEASTGKTYTTYTRTKTDGTVYAGRTSGTKTPEQQVAVRTSRPDHQAKTVEGYGPATVDKNSSNPDAIRGREQQLIGRP
jgi:RHS repeat-associated protein